LWREAAQAGVDYQSTAIQVCRSDKQNQRGDTKSGDDRSPPPTVSCGQSH
jgi:hypothetical protein